MKHFARFVLIGLPSLWFAACAVPETSSRGPMVQPRVGMTRAEVVQAYGTPSRTTVTSRGEIWTYWLNKPGVLGLSLGAEPKTAGFVFDPAGIVVDYHVSQ